MVNSHKKVSKLLLLLTTATPRYHAQGWGDGVLNFTLKNQFHRSSAVDPHLFFADPYPAFTNLSKITGTL